MIVDSASPTPLPPLGRCFLHRFPDNIGHLSRYGRDGWGRAFCQGLQHGIGYDYDVVVHIEGDSLFRLPVLPIVEAMQADVLSVPVRGMALDYADWVETGLMFFRVPYLRSSGFIEKYQWPFRQVSPTPEVVVKQLVHNSLWLMPWRAFRGDKIKITTENVGDFDWITHCHKDVEVYDRFVESVLGKSIDDD